MPSSVAQLPAITVFSLGGTIAMTGEGPEGVVPTLTGEALVAAVPEIQKVARVNAVPFRQLPGAHIGFADLEALACAIAEAFDNGADGVVVTQGTDTIEETAFILDRLLDPSLPTVVTGAMRNPTLPGADGPANLLSAIRIAASGATAGAGVTVVLNDEVHAARFVRKSSTTNPATFVSPGLGPVGFVVEDRVRILLRPKLIPPLKLGDADRKATVALITLGLGDDGALIQAARNSGADGLVVEAMGGGHAPAAAAEALGRVAKDCPVILASRTGGGEVLASTYGFPGSEIDLQGRGLLRSGHLDGLKARILLTLLLRRGTGRIKIAEAFAAWGGG